MPKSTHSNNLVFDFGAFDSRSSARVTNNADPVLFDLRIIHCDAETLHRLDIQRSKLCINFIEHLFLLLGFLPGDLLCPC